MVSWWGYNMVGIGLIFGVDEREIAMVTELSWLDEGEMVKVYQGECKDCWGYYKVKSVDDGEMVMGLRGEIPIEASKRRGMDEELVEWVEEWLCSSIMSPMTDYLMTHITCTIKHHMEWR